MDKEIKFLSDKEAKEKREQLETELNIRPLEKKGKPVQTENFVDLYDEDGKLITKEERQKSADDFLDERIEIILPTYGKLISDFANEVGDILSKTNTMFFRPESREIYEIGKIKEENETLGFVLLKGDRFVSVAEIYFKPSVEHSTRYGVIIKEKSMSSQTANILLASPQLQNKLPIIKRIFPIPLPIISDQKLTFPKQGYDPILKSWMPFNAPKINQDMSLEDAKEIISKIYGEFCFKTQQDYTNAIAGLLTPFLRGIFSKFCVRVPLFLYLGNRERVGKDYCAGINGLIYEGFVTEEPPISCGGNSSNNNEELRKKLLSLLISGRKRVHFANNKGYMNNAVLEMFLTSEKFSDRKLGGNEILNLDNEMDCSGSGNIGIKFTPDLLNRTKTINLFLDIEDANSRDFKNPNLHGWVKNNRTKIISAMFSLVKNWFNKGCPDGKILFSSFPEWARICGGIMESAGYDNPCVADKEVLKIGVDSETKDMKELFEICYGKKPNTPLTKQEIRNLISMEEIFSYLDFDKRSDQTKFGNKIMKFIGRVFSNIRMNVVDSSIRTSRQQYIFKKIEECNGKL